MGRGFILKFLVERPIISQIELTNACNLECPMCPRLNHMNRKIEFMDFELFKSIIMNINIVSPCNGRSLVQLYHFGESLLHPEIEKILIHCKKQKIPTMISSNGNCLNKEKRTAIIGNLDVLWISFDSINKETYERMRKGASFEKTIDNVTQLMIEKGDKIPKVILSTLIHDDKEEYETFWRKKGVENFIFKNYHSWRGEPDIKRFTGIKQEHCDDLCLYLVKHFCILVDGRVVPCCMDYNGEMILGDLKYQTIEEVWYGEQYKRLRIIHNIGKKNEINLCKDCTIYPKLEIRKDIDYGT